MIPNFFALLFALIVMSCEFTPAILYGQQSFPKHNFESESSLHSVTNYVRSNAAEFQSRKNFLNPRNYKWIYHNKTINSLFAKSPINNLLYLETQSIYSPSVYTKADRDNENIADKINRQQQLIQDTSTYGSPYELNKANINYIFHPHQLVANSKQSSNDHLQALYFATYVASLPSNFDMHPNLHQLIPIIIYKTPTIASHATSSESSPITRESIKQLTSIKNIQHVLKKGHDEIVNNKLNYYDRIAKDTSTTKTAVSKTDSKQYFYAPRRSSSERELPHSSNNFPYPPSFISITTTEVPFFTYCSINNKVPDVFKYRQYKSLWDSYIPSWEVSKMVQQFENKPNKNNFQTLAFSKENQMKFDK